MTALTLYPYQKKWLADKSRFKLGRFARQTGKTFTTTLEIVDDLYEAEARGIRSPWVILSRGERQSKEAMEEGIFRHLDAYSIALSAVARTDYDFLDEDSGVRRTALQIVMPGKQRNRITALPANPDTARGFSANVFSDEFAFHKDSRKIWTALFPCVSAGWKMRVTSTSNGKDNKFYDLATTTDPIWSRHEVDILQAVADGLPRDVDELRRGLMDDDAWAQEYMLQWLDEASAWLSYDLINTVEHDHAGLSQHYAAGPCYVGIDIGRRKDLFVIWVFELVGDVLWTREILAKQRIRFAEMDALIDEVFLRYNVVRCCMDQTGMGEKMVEDAQTRHGALRVEGIIFTLPSKLILATQGKQAFEDRKVRIPLADVPLRSDLHSLKKIPTATGAARFDADSTESGHADRAWACFLAINAAAGKKWSAGYQGGGRRHAPANDADDWEDASRGRSALN